MPRFERPKNSVLTDFGERETAAAWNINEDPLDLPPEVRTYEGLYPPCTSPTSGSGL